MAKTKKKAAPKTAKKVTKTVAKKPAVKKVTKKSTPKKVVKKTVAKKPAVKSLVHGNASANEQFYLESGKVLKNVKGLADELEKMPANVYSHHVNSERNDFANWIEYVFKDAKLAGKVRKAKSKDSVRIEIYKYLLEKR